jgi:tetratricopeptide (TPR) repeat protein
MGERNGPFPGPFSLRAVRAYCADMTDVSPSPPPDEPAQFNLEIEGDGKDAITRLRKNVEYWVSRGRYNKVRIKRGGKAVLPDIPVGALVAFEAATFFWTGLLRGVLMNTVGRVLFEVELVNEADEHYRKGLAHFLAGEMSDAEEALGRALRVDQRHVRAHLQMGVLRKVQGRSKDAIAHFERVLELDVVGKKPGESAREAEVHLAKLRA